MKILETILDQIDTTLLQNEESTTSEYMRGINQCKQIINLHINESKNK